MTFLCYHYVNFSIISQIICNRPYRKIRYGDENPTGLIRVLFIFTCLLLDIVIERLEIRD